VNRGLVASGRHHKSHPHGGASAPYPRARRVNEVLRQVVAEELERLADADERLRMVTVTEVETAADLRNATVFLATLEADADEALQERRAQLQRAVGQQVRMKRTPRLHFVADPSVSAGARVDEVLRRLGHPAEDADPDPALSDEGHPGSSADSS